MKLSRDQKWLLWSIALGLAMAALLFTLDAWSLDRVTVEATWYPAKGYVCAVNWLPLGTVVRLTYKNHILYARVTDRYDQNDPLNQGWRIDCSVGIAEVMGWKRLGRVKMELEVVPWEAHNGRAS